MRSSRRSTSVLQHHRPQQQQAVDQKEAYSSCKCVLISSKQVIEYILVSDLQRTKEPEKILEQSAFHFADALGKEFPEYAFHIGMGQTYQKLLYASRSFKEAQITLTMNIGEQKELKCPVTCFSRMGIFRILLNSDYKEELEEIAYESIHILAQYDRENGTEYYKTFLCFYEHNCSIKETAAAEGKRAINPRGTHFLTVTASHPLPQNLKFAPIMFISLTFCTFSHIL